MTNHPVPLSEVFGTAADRIETDGWSRTWGTSTAAPSCAEGALVKAAIATGADRSTLAEAFAVLRAVVGDWIPRWNDNKQRTETDVVQTLRACAVAAQRNKDTTLLALPASTGDRTKELLDAIDTAPWETEVPR